MAAERTRLRGSDDGLSTTRLREVEAELRYVERRLATFVVTAPPGEPVRAGFGCRITLDGPRRRVVRIVGVDEVDPAAGEISWLSPLARALTGAQLGDVVTVRTPAGEEEWELVALIAAP